MPEGQGNGVVGGDVVANVEVRRSVHLANVVGVDDGVALAQPFGVGALVEGVRVGVVQVIDEAVWQHLAHG